MKKIEKTFTVRVPVARAWAAFADSHERSQWEAAEYEIDARPGGRVRWTLPGIESTGRVDEVVPNRLLRQVDLSGPHTTAEITVTFEEVEGGTRISITHAGFGTGEDWDEWLEGTSIGWDQAIADLIVYLHTGVTAGRFVTEMHSPGMTMTDTAGGVEVVTVLPGMLADQAGLAPGDLVLRMGATPVYHITDIWVLMREHPAGTKFEIEYVRDGAVGHGVGVVTGGWDPPADLSPPEA
jgi:uncharacterized protein YndB with AHSA1/START domain